jgi:hypothetical protein
MENLSVDPPTRYSSSKPWKTRTLETQGFIRRRRLGAIGAVTLNELFEVRIQDHMTAGELSAIRLCECAAGDKFTDEKLQGPVLCATATRMAGQEIGLALERIRDNRVQG